MKTNLLSLTLLATLVACNGGSGGKSSKQNVDLSKYKDNLVPTRGLVSISEKTGTDKSFDFTKDEPSISVESVNEKTKSIILKVDENKIYKLVETEDVNSGSKTSKIEIEGNDDVKDISKEPGTSLRLINDTLFMTVAHPYQSFGGTYDINGKNVQIMSDLNANLTVNMLKPHCDSVTVINSNSYLLVDGVKGKTASDSTKEVSTCGKILTNDELKAIDLTRIETCDYTVLSEENDSPECEFADMSELTADL